MQHDIPGATIALSENGEIKAINAYGYANIEIAYLCACAKSGQVDPQLFHSAWPPGDFHCSAVVLSQFLEKIINYESHEQM